MPRKKAAQDETNAEAKPMFFPNTKCRSRPGRKIRTSPMTDPVPKPQSVMESKGFIYGKPERSAINREVLNCRV